jgi:ribonucleotide reductase alpha subunit
LKQYEDGGYHIEDCLYSTNTKVVTFYVKDPLVEKIEKLGINPEIVEGANDVSMADMLAVQSMLQECYADNAVSFTVNLEPDAVQNERILQQVESGISNIVIGEASDSTVDEVAKTIIHYLPHLKGTTIMVDGGRPQAPFERISKEEFERSEFEKELGQGELECSVNGCPVR